MYDNKFKIKIGVLNNRFVNFFSYASIKLINICLCMA